MSKNQLTEIEFQIFDQTILYYFVQMNDEKEIVKCLLKHLLCMLLEPGASFLCLFCFMEI